MQIQTNFTSNLLNRTETQNVLPPIAQTETKPKSDIFNKSVQPTLDKATNGPSNSFIKNIKAVGVAILGIATLAFGLKGIKTLINRPSKKNLELIDFINSKGNSFKTIIEESKTQIKQNYLIAQEKVYKIIRANEIEAPQKEVLLQKIEASNSTKEILENEDAATKHIYTWLAETVQRNEPKMQEMSGQMLESKQSLEQSLSSTVTVAKEKINELITVPESLKKGKNAQNILINFDEIIGGYNKQIDTMNNNALKLFDEDAKAEFANYYNKVSGAVDVKNSLMIEIIEKSNLALDKHLQQNEVSNAAVVNMDVLPSTLPQSIIDSKFYKLISEIDVNAKESHPKLLEFSAEMDKNSSLKDLNIIKERLNLRMKASNKNAAERSWYEISSNNMGIAESKISEVFENQFYNSGKNIDTQHLSEEQAKLTADILKAFSEKLGVSSVNKMILDFMQKQSSKNNHFDSGTYKIYQKVKKMLPEDQKDFTNNIIERTEKNLDELLCE